VAVTGVLIVADLTRPPGSQVATRALLAAIDVYQVTLSPLYARAGVMCRFKPTCSHYGEAVIREFGAIRGGWMALRRVLRCGPWTPAGTEDQPPANSFRPSSFSSTQQA
jgi:uncharacterized protein